MLQALRKRIERDEDGFTLIELMVVVLIIGILLAIAVPTFLKAQDNAKSKAATSNLRSGLSAVKTHYADVQSYNASDFTAAALEAVEPTLTWQTTGSAQPNQVSFAIGTDAIGLAVKSKHNICYFIIDNVSSTAGGTFYGKAASTPAGTCAAVTTGYTNETPSAAGW